MITQEDWMNASATESLNMSEMDDLVTQSVAAWKKYDEVKAVSSQAHEEAEAIDRKILLALKAAGKSKYFVDGKGTVSVTQKTVVRVPSNIEAKLRLFNHLKSLGEEVFLSLATVNSNTLNSWYNEKLEESTSKGILGFSVPGVDEPTMRESLRFQSVKKGKTDVEIKSGS